MYGPLFDTGQTFVEASKRQLVLAPELDEPPSLPTLLKAGWLLTVYCSDVLSRIEEVRPYFFLFLFYFICHTNYKKYKWRGDLTETIGNYRSLYHVNTRECTEDRFHKEGKIL